MEFAEKPMYGDWRRRIGMKKIHLFAAKPEGMGRVAFGESLPMCGARVHRGDTDHVRGLTTRSRDICTECVIAEISRVTSSKPAAEGGDS